MPFKFTKNLLLQIVLGEKINEKILPAEILESNFTFLNDISNVVRNRVKDSLAFLGEKIVIDEFVSGKMLRSQFAVKMAGNSNLINSTTFCNACAAIELVHTASLCHDDVIDRADERRKKDSLWKQIGNSGAILTGDLLLINATTLLAMSDEKSYLPAFLNKITEMIETESEQELLLRGIQIDEATSLRIARSKTGSLFAFLGHVCGDGDERLSKTLEEAGYLIGAIYQLADDIFDVVSSDEVAGKTLGTDNKRGKLTLPQTGNDGIKATVALIKEQYFRAIEVLAPYPEKQDALKLFISEDIKPIIKQHDFQIAFI